MNESYEMTFTLKDADMIKLAEIFGDININDCPYFEIQDKYGNSAKYYRENPPSAQPDLQPTCNQLATDCISRQAAIDALEKCMSCKHVYQRIDDADTLYCRCRKGCRYEEFKPRRSNRNLERYED